MIKYLPILFIPLIFFFFKEDQTEIPTIVSEKKEYKVVYKQEEDEETDNLWDSIFNSNNKSFLVTEEDTLDEKLDTLELIERSLLFDSRTNSQTKKTNDKIIFSNEPNLKMELIKNDDFFHVEKYVGRIKTISNCEKDNFEDIKNKIKDLLHEKIELKKSIHQENEMVFCTLDVGYFESKNSAAAWCRKITKKNIPCIVQWIK